MRALVAAATLVGSFVAPSQARAATLDVCPSGCPFSTIQAAVDAATAGDVIAVGAGVYTETVVVAKDVTISGTQSAAAVIDGGGTGSTVTVAAGNTVTIEDLTIRGGAATGGAGIDNAGTLTIRRVDVNGNVATFPGSVAGGGGIANRGVLTVIQSSISGNTADRGGGVWNEGGAVTIERSSIVENVARSYGGGGVAAALSSARLIVRGTVIAGNRVIAPGTDQRGGGGVWVSQADVLLEDVEVRDNTSGYSAGGIYLSGSFTRADLVRTTVSRNTNGTDPNRGVGRGGGISVRNSAQVGITDSTIADNSAAGSGGGIEASSTVTITNSTISGNAAVGSGGGIAVDAAVTLDSVTIAGNTAGRGGGIADVGRTPIVRNVAIGDNAATVLGADCVGDVFVDTGQIALVESTAGCVPAGGGTVLTGDPNLGPLQDNGGPTPTMLPGPGSPLLDAGATTLTTDQRGLPRPVGAGADLGAVELQAPPAPEADLSLVMVPRALDIAAGLSETYEVTVFNDGPSDATAVDMTLQFSGEIQPLALPPDCIDESAAGRIRCILPTLADGSLHTFSLPILFPSGGTQTVTAQVVADEDDPDTDDAEALGVVQVLGGSGADVSAALAVDSGDNEYGQVLAGTPIVVNAAASNRGPNDATDVTLELTVPTGWSLGGLDPRCTIGFPDVDVITCDLGDIPRPFDQRFPTTRLAQITLVPTGPADIVAVVATTASDPAPGNDTATMPVDVLAQATDLSVRNRLAPPAEYVLGETTNRLPIELRKSPDGVATNPRFSVSVSPSIGVVGLDVEQLGFSWSCTDVTATRLDCEATRDDVIPEDFAVALTVDDIGDVDVRDYEIEVAVQARSAFELDPSNDVDTGLITFAKAPPIDVLAIEVTQGVQDWELSVDLIAGKRTAARVFLEDSARLGGRTGGELRATRNGLPLVPASVTPIVSSVPTPGDAAAVRDELNLSLAFLLPDSWTAEGEVEIEYVVSNEYGREAHCLEPVGSPNCRVTIEFLPAQEVTLDLLAISYVTDEVQELVLTDPIEPDDEAQVAASGTFTISDGTESTGDIAHDASEAEVEAALEALAGFAPDAVSVRRMRSEDLPDDARGWRISLREQQDLPLLTVDGTDLDDATIAVRAGYDGGRLVQISGADMIEQLARLESVLPISSTDVQWFTPPTFDFKPITYADVNPYLEMHRVAQIVSCPGGCRPGGLRVGGYMNGGGIVGSGGNNDGAVFSVYTGSDPGPNDAGYARNRGPHELAHSFGKSHSVVEERDETSTIGLCGAIGGPDAELHPYTYSTPYENPGLELDAYDKYTWPTIGPLGIGTQREVWGLDVRLLGTGASSALTIQDPNRVASLMSYCDGGNQSRWPSKFGYELVHQGIVAGTVGFPEDDGVVADRLVVTGTVDVAAGEVDLGTIVGARGVRPLPVDGGVIEVALVDDTGAVLDSTIVELQGDDSAGDPPAGERATEDRTRLFSAVLDAPPTDVAALVVSDDGEELGRVPASAAAPTVVIDSPIPGVTIGAAGLTVEWSASDADGDELSAAVYYSAGGDEWRPIALAVTGDRLDVPLSALGRSDAARVRVVVSDGLRTATATSGSFVVGDAPPTVEIVSMEPGASTPADAAVVFDAIAIDAEDGRLNGATATWRSDLSGELGVGTPLVVPAGVLSPGCHRVSVTFADSGGHEGIATTTVGVGEPCDEGESDGEVVVVQESPAAPGLAIPYTTSAPAAPDFELVDGSTRRFAAAAGAVVIDQLVPEGYRTSIVCDDPSGGSQIDVPAGRATVDLDPGESVTCTFTTAPINSPPRIEIVPASTTVQVGDGIAPMTVAVVDADSPPATLTVSVDGLPPGLAASAPSCGPLGDGATCQLSITGTAAGSPGTYVLEVDASDGIASTSATATVVVAPEDAVVRLPGSNPASVIIGPGDDGGTFDVTVRTVERDPDLASGTPGVTDLAGADVAVRLEPVGPGGTVTPAACAHRVVGGVDDQTLVTTCTFVGVGPNTYAIVADVEGDFAGRADDVVVVHELTDRATRGAGEVAAPDGAVVRFAFEMEYTGRGKNAKGAFVAVRTEADGSQHVVRSNSVTGLAFGTHLDDSWVSFVGKATYAAPGDEAVGNHRFVVYAEDGGATDRFWFELRDRDDAVLSAVGMPGDGVDGAAVLSDGEIRLVT